MTNKRLELVIMPLRRISKGGGGGKTLFLCIDFQPNVLIFNQ
jgi:hypothetical protein